MRFHLPLDSITMILGSKELPVTNPLQSRNVKYTETVSSLLCPLACDLMPFHYKNHGSVEIDWFMSLPASVERVCLCLQEVLGKRAAAVLWMTSEMEWGYLKPDVGCLFGWESAYMNKLSP